MPKGRGVSPLPLFWEIFRRLTSKRGLDKHTLLIYTGLVQQDRKGINMKEKLMEHLDIKLEQVQRAMNTWEDSVDMAIAFYNQALGAVELAGWLVYQDNPELEQEILKMWNDEYRIKFEEIIWG